MKIGMRRMKKVKNLDWLNADTVSKLKDYARSQVEGNVDQRELFAEGFMAGIDFLRKSVEATVKEKERTAATDVL
jgi:hypothetical protein